MKKHKVIIVGAGPAGIAAVNTLTRKNPKIAYKVISEDIGGRIVSSADGLVQYGAYFIQKDYKNALDIVVRKKRLSSFGARLYDENLDVSAGYKIFLHPIQVTKLVVQMTKFAKHFKRFRLDSVQHGQKSALENNEYLLGLFQESAESFADRHGFSGIAEKYMPYWINTLAFTDAANISALDLLRFSTGALSGYYRYTFKPSAYCEEWGDRYIKDSVTEITHNEQLNCYEVRIGKKVLQTEYVIVATPPEVTKKLVGIDKVKGSVDAYMFHLTGSLLKKWRSSSDNIVFKPPYAIISISKEQDGSYLLYAKVPSPEIDDFFSEYTIIAKKHWSPALNLIVSDTLVDQKINNNVYIAGDFNIAGIEDSYITGIYAANQILKEM